MTFKNLDNQLSDDFLMGYDETNGMYAAIRSPKEPCSFVILDKDYWLCATRALEKFQEYVLSLELKAIPNWDDEQKQVIWTYR